MADITLRERYTDDQVRAVYATLIEASWEGADLFEPHQEAWKAVAAAWGIEDIEDNGHGKVRRTGARSSKEATR
jgi:hypothetical protein